MWLIKWIYIEYHSLNVYKQFFICSRLTYTSLITKTHSKLNTNNFLMTVMLSIEYSVFFSFSF